MENFTETSSNSWNNDLDTIDCNDLTNNGLYLIFTGYLLPLLSPKLRAYGKEMLSSFKNFGKVASDIVSITEFGFEKIQGLTSNEEMVDFIVKRLFDSFDESDESDELRKSFNRDDNKRYIRMVLELKTKREAMGS